MPKVMKTIALGFLASVLLAAIYLHLCKDALRSLEPLALALVAMSGSSDRDSGVAGIPVPNAVESHYWRTEGRERLEMQLRHSPELRILVLNAIDERRARGDALKEDRVADMKAAIERGEREGVKEIRRLVF